MTKESNGIRDTWVQWALGIMLAATFTFTTWTAQKVVALEKQTFSYQSGAKAEQVALEEKFDGHCIAQVVQSEKVQVKLDRTYDAVLRIGEQIKRRP